MNVAATEQLTSAWRRQGVALALVVAVLVGWNVVGNLVVPGTWYVPTNLAVTAVLVGIAAWAGISAADLGLSCATASAGLRWGGAVGAVVIVVVALGTLVPFAADAYADDRVDLDGVGLVFDAVVRIPLGTVMLEEVAFRGVLLALVVRVLVGRAARRSVADPRPLRPDQAAAEATPRVLWQAVAASSVLFGLWHIVPSVPAARGNGYVATAVVDPTAMAAVVAAAVLATTIAGLVFCWVRLRSNSLVAPMVVHVATNSGSLSVAWLLAG